MPAMSASIFALVVSVSFAAPAVAQHAELTTDNALQYRGSEGRRFTVVCQPKTQHSPVWGTDVYLDHSSICGAGLHAGVISLAEGGAVTAVISTGRASYTGSTRNGVTSRDYDVSNGSFTVEKGDGGQIEWYTNAHGLQSTSKPLAVFCPAGGNVSAHRAKPAQ